MGAMCRSDPKVRNSTIATQQAGGSCSSWEVEPHLQEWKKGGRGRELESQPYCNEVKFKLEIKLKENKSDIGENHKHNNSYLNLIQSS